MNKLLDCTCRLVAASIWLVAGLLYIAVIATAIAIPFAVIYWMLKWCGLL